MSTLIKSLKTILKNVLPTQGIAFINKFRDSREEAAIYRYDARRFHENRLNNITNATQVHLEAKLTFHAHSLEKGLSHEKIRLGFGRTAMEQLSIALLAYQKLQYDKDSLAYQNALAVIKAYISIHRKAHYDITNVIAPLEFIISEAEDCKSDIGGAMDIHKDSKKNNHNKNFIELFEQRYSIREFDEEKVDKTKVLDSIKLSIKAPSVCNRQPARVYIVEEPQVIKEILQIQGGLTGYKLPSVLLCVVVDLQAFVHPTERNQGFIDGGSFAMALLLALEYNKLAACPLNAMFSVKQDIAMRKVLNIKNSETIIMFVAVGNFKKNTTVPKSFRYNVEDITSYSH